MQAVAAYAIAYAQFEAENGAGGIPAVPELGDKALRDALASFSENGLVTDAGLFKAKSILRVGDEVGKIDQIRRARQRAETERVGSE